MILKPNTSIRLILETDAIIQPLTGIGRYAMELLRAFLASDEFSDIRCFSRGHWHEPKAVMHSVNLLREADGNTREQEPPTRWSGNSVKSLLRRVLPYVSQRRLDKYSDTHLYHSPNYRLSPFAGKKIATFHDLSLFLYPQYHPQDRLKVLTPAIEQAAQEADHLIVDSAQVRNEVMAYFNVPEDRITAIPLASSLDANSLDESARDRFLLRLGLKPGGYFLFVSTLEPRKNISGLLGAYELLPANVRKHYPLVLAGQLGWKSDDIEQALERGKRRGDVIQPGYLSNLQVCQLYSGARAFVYPSFYEGFGLPILEAQGFGIPVITSNCSCMPEVAGSGALLINPEAYAALADAMCAIIDDHELHARISRLGLENSRQYSWANTAQQTMELYRSVLQK
jgi:glycosyltransferase involved in cell wall biosynthesis